LLNIFFKTSVASVTPSKTNIRILHQIVGLELSECDEERFVDTKELSEDVIRGKTHNAMAKRKITNW
jgi:hypothetical protein